MVRIIIGGVLIIGGLTGHMVLRGTQSSTALVAVGALFVVLGFARVARRM